MKRSNIIIDSQQGVVFDGGIEELWLSYHEISELFNVFASLIKKRISTILSSGIFNEKDVCSTSEYMIKGKKHYVELYNIDIIIALSYSVNSLESMMFRRYINDLMRKKHELCFQEIKLYIIVKSRTVSDKIIN